MPSHPDPLLRRLAALLNSPAQWSGLAVATAVVLASAFGVRLPGGWLAVVLGYGLGFGVAGWWFGFSFRRAGRWGALTSPSCQAADLTLPESVDRLRHLLEANPDTRLSPCLQARALQLCEQLADLAGRLEARPHQLSADDAFHAKRIVTSYLPEALRSYLAIDPRAARSLRLGNGLTAEATLAQSLDELAGEARRLQEALTAQDSEDLLSQARFLQDKFGTRRLPADRER